MQAKRGRLKFSRPAKYRVARSWLVAMLRGRCARAIVTFTGDEAQRAAVVEQQAIDADGAAYGYGCGVQHLGVAVDVDHHAGGAAKLREGGAGCQRDRVYVEAAAGGLGRDRAADRLRSQVHG